MVQGVMIIEAPITMKVDEKYKSSTLIDFKGQPFTFSAITRTPDITGVGWTTYNTLYITGCSASINLVDIDTNTPIAVCSTICSTNISYQNRFNFGNGYCTLDVYDGLDGFAMNLTSIEIQLTRLNQTDPSLVNTSIISAVMYDGNSITNLDKLQEIIKGNKTGITASLPWYFKDYSTCKEAKQHRETYACVSKNSDCYDAPLLFSSDTNDTIGYTCRCITNYDGNPYTQDGCQESDFALSPAKECTVKCGSIDIPFPFGLENGCYREEPFHLLCDESVSPPTLTVASTGDTVNSISLEEGQLEANGEYPVMDKTSLFDYGGYQKIYNWVIARQSCEAAKATNYTTFACFAKHSECTELKNRSNSRDIFGYWCKCSKGFKGNPYLVDGCKDINECDDPNKYICYGICSNVEGNYNCTCPEGSSGDPRQKACIPGPKMSTLLLGVTIGISSGVGLLLHCAIFFIIRKKFKKRHQKRMRERYFHQNHGLLLKQLISSGENIDDRTKIFSLEEIEKATNNFDKTRILGHGGHGMVYKGILSDQRLVAIKKSKIIKRLEINQFINEVVILSQVNHRNIVRLFGCCLETEVPLLIYEFISSGALSDHLHIGNGSSALAWEDRLRIATEAAGALAYLHSAASISILHRDVKSSNIPLDDHFAAKISDFGASRFIPLDQTHVVTTIQGTFGYLDPEYYQTSHLTQKSDVYGFGVILLELLTGKKPIYTTEDQQDLNLAMCFLQAIRENHCSDLIEDSVLKESNEEELNEIIQLIQICLKLKGVDRPTMKEVEYKLQNLRKIKIKKNGHCVSEGGEETKLLLNATSYAFSDGTSRNYSMEKEVIWSQDYPR